MNAFFKGNPSANFLQDNELAYFPRKDLNPHKQIQSERHLGKNV